jgi:S1-C subfamily serine protease
MEPTDMGIPEFGEITEQLRRSTVLIHSGGRGSGSGVIWLSDGVLVTNAHVIRGVRPKVQLWDGRKLASAFQGRGPRLLRLEFFRGDYERIRRVTVQLGNPLPARSSVAA